MASECDHSLWCQVINALYGSKVDSHQTHYSSNWCSILREVHKLKDKGFDFWYHIKKRIGNGADTSFWYDCWFGDIPFCVKYPRLFALELDKQVSVESKLLSSMESSFRRNVRGGIEQHMLEELTSTLETQVLRRICRWWELDPSDWNTFQEWYAWFSSIRFSSKSKSLLEGTFFVALVGILWWIRNR
ncbi:hypothetical protein Tco_1524732 [Tanacetum coccineum]